MILISKLETHNSKLSFVPPCTWNISAGVGQAHLSQQTQAYAPHGPGGWKNVLIYPDGML
jgi:hypothetical protein